MSDDVAGHDLLEQVEQLIGDALADVERIFQEELASGHPYVTDVLAHMSRFRGKRLRPFLLLLAARAVGEINDSHKVLAAVVEMIHTATLVHDDVLDEAITRRHVATVNTRWNNETSVLLGDYLFTHAFHLASSLESTDACRAIGRSTNIICEGELSQIHQRGNLDLTEEEYLRIIEGKTAELCALCCGLGARYASTDEDVVASLERYGRYLGMAFQIADDLLDLLGDEREAGKTLRTDLSQQKLTLPLIRLLEQTNGSDSGRLRELLGRPTRTIRSELQPFLEHSDAIRYARSRALEYAARGCEQLAILPDSPARRMLEEVTEFAAQRSF